MTDQFKNIASGDLVMLIENERAYKVESRYLAPYSKQPMLCVVALDWSFNGTLGTICGINDVVKLTSHYKGGGHRGKKKG